MWDISGRLLGNDFLFCVVSTLRSHMYEYAVFESCHSCLVKFRSPSLHSKEGKSFLLPAGAKTHQGNNQGRHPYHPYHQIRISNNVYIYSFYPRTVVNWNSLTINASVNSLVKFKWLWHHQLSSHCFSPFYDNSTGNICIDLTIFITFHIRNTRFYFHFY